jgi:hypothetical protein
MMNERFRVGLAIDFQVWLLRAGLAFFRLNQPQDLISRFTLDSASEFLFGHCINSLSAGLPYPYNATQAPNAIEADDTAGAFSDAFSRAQLVINRRVTIGQTWPLIEILADHTAQHMKVVNAFLDPILKDALAKHSATAKIGISESADDETLVDHLVKLTSGEITRIRRIFICSNILFRLQNYQR